ncbi:monocarboxylate transporter 13-like [Amphiura filiformis]|uniref:monocarboxylate transporter 13-like n=1 Tax=Amphiura filiformis TaxID=82378 RepID=UPI003B22770E
MAGRQKIIHGRIVVGTLFLSYVLSVGLLQIIGAYMPALSDEFNVGSAILGWICSFGNAVLCLAGPVAGVIINKAEPRWVVMIGGLIQASGLILTYLAKTTTVLYFSLGLLPGYVVSATGIGVTSGIQIPLLYTIIRRNVGTWQLSTAVGLELLIDGLGIMVGGYLAGAIQQLSGNYSLSFYLVGSAYTLAVCFFLPVLLMERRAKTWIPIPTAKTEVGTRE